MPKNSEEEIRILSTRVAQTREFLDPDITVSAMYTAKYDENGLPVLVPVKVNELRGEREERNPEDDKVDTSATKAVVSYEEVLVQTNFTLDDRDFIPGKNLQDLATIINFLLTPVETFLKFCKKFFRKALQNTKILQRM